MLLFITYSIQGFGKNANKFNRLNCTRHSIRLFFNFHFKLFICIIPISLYLF